MARIEIKKVWPFTTWDAEKKRGEVTSDYFFTLEMETSKRKAGMYPFRVCWHINNEDVMEYRHTSVDDALEDMTKRTLTCARSCGWTPESE